LHSQIRIVRYDGRNNHRRYYAHLNKKIDGIDFYAPSTKKHKKYDAYVDNQKFSFGDNRYQQYYDKIGYYSYLNHYDKKRRYNYMNRHKNDKLNEFSSGYFSYYYLW